MTDLVVMGLGYAGLPLARAAVGAGLAVVGYDVDADRVAQLEAATSPVGDVSDVDLQTMRDAGFVATTDPACLSAAAAAVICVPTPLTDDRGPDLTAVRAAAATVAVHLRPRMLVVLESTSYPGTTEEVVAPILERSGLRAGVDFHLAFSPERVDPGNAQWTLANTPKVVGGLTAACAEAASALYERFTGGVVRTRGTREAEMAKLLENTYRQVNIALVNEMAVFCDELGIDLWDAIAAASTKPFGFAAFWPGPGTGGHCIPIDPGYLSYKVRTLGYPFRFVELAAEVNTRMPAYVAARVQRLLNDEGKAVRGARVLLVGVTYKRDVADERESPAQPLARRLLELGADLAYHDVHVPVWQVDGRTLAGVEDVLEAASGADVVVLLQAHSLYDLAALAAAAPRLLDTRGVVSGPGVQRL